MSKHRDIIERILAVPLNNGRRIIALVGGPASGKSTLSAKLQNGIPNSCVVPMDGFHRDNDDLERHGLLARKGAPKTFDVNDFVSIIKALRNEGEVSFPTFDRANDCVVPDNGTVTPSDTTIIVEGNYLLLNVAPWDELAEMWDLSISLDVPLGMLQSRLITRWLKHGHSAEEATQRALANDIPNAKFVLENSKAADLVV